MEKVKEIVIKCLENIGIFVDEQDYEENICEYGMSSLDYVLLICEIEEVLDIELPAEYLNIQEIVSINKLTNIVLDILAQKKVPAI